MDFTKARVAADKISKAEGCDVLFYNGDIRPDSSGQISVQLASRQLAKSVTLVIVTSGGDPDAAFKIGRSLQNSYEEITVFVPGWCKSAGTLVAIAAHKLIIADDAELGPLDIQLAKSDEIGELGSGLTVDASLKSLEGTAIKMFVNIMVGIRKETFGAITTRTAADLASKMVTGLLEPVFRQIDPIKIGENSRAMNITKGYGSRLNMVSKNLRSPQMLDFLVSAYPDHRFVIDRTEARLIFSRVMEPSPSYGALAQALGEAASSPVPKLGKREGLPYIEFLSSEVNNAQGSENAPQKRSAVRKRVRAVRSRANGSAPPALNGRA